MGGGGMSVQHDPRGQPEKQAKFETFCIHIDRSFSTVSFP